MKLLIFVGINLGGYVGWELGERLGTMTAFLLSGAGVCSESSRAGGWREGISRERTGRAAMPSQSHAALSRNQNRVPPFGRGSQPIFPPH